MNPSEFKDDVEYTNAIIKKVRRTHSIDDRLENARRETISMNYTTQNIWPTSLSSPLVKDSETNELRQTYFVKAMVPLKKQTYETTYDINNLASKPKFKKIGDAEIVDDQVIFGVLTSDNFVGQIPPVQICDQNHDAQAAWYSKHFE